MSVVANSGLNSLLFQQALKSPPVENKVLEKEVQQQDIDDFADLSTPAKMKIQHESLSQLSSPLSTGNEVPEIEAQKAILTEKQNNIDLQAVPESLNSIKSHIINEKDKAIFQTANQSKENILALIT